MKKKPQISYSISREVFFKDGGIISETYAREIWDAGTADWTLGAYNEMARRVMA